MNKPLILQNRDKRLAKEEAEIFDRISKEMPEVDMLLQRLVDGGILSTDFDFPLSLYQGDSDRFLRQLNQTYNVQGWYFNTTGMRHVTSFSGGSCTSISLGIHAQWYNIKKPWWKFWSEE